MKRRVGMAAAVLGLVSWAGWAGLGPARAQETGAGSVTLEIKLSEGLEARLEAGRLRSLRGGSLDALQVVLARRQARDVRPLIHGNPVARLQALARAAEARSGRPAPDLASWFHVDLPAGAPVDEALAELRAMPEVEYAYAAPAPVEPPQTATPDFRWRQILPWLARGYFAPAPRGIDALFSWQDRRARGAGVLIVDLEYNVNFFHEDLQLDPSVNIGGPDFPLYPHYGDDHGTAVLGILVGRDNGYGITGGVPEADVAVISPTFGPGYSWQPADAMVLAATFMRPGDVFLIEQQTVGPNGGARYCPIEWIPSAFEATQLMTQLGIVVVASGGNGGDSLDGPEYLGRFDRGVRDSGAILVGAGTSDTAHARLGFSVHGSRLDLQGWGRHVTTTGYGTLYTGPLGKDQAYTWAFNGTSSAAAHVTAAVAAVQSYLKATNRPVWSGARIADLLEQTGTAQGGRTALTEPIGPLPNLKAALEQIEPGVQVAVPPGR